MKKKVISNYVRVLSFCMVIVSGNVTHATEISIKEEGEKTRTESYISMINDFSQGRVYEENEAKGIFTTKYRVSVSKATMRSGPGTEYASLGTLHKNDIVWVRSISNGWAKFKVNSKWHYISKNCIKKATY